MAIRFCVLKFIPNTYAPSISSTFKAEAKVKMIWFWFHLGMKLTAGLQKYPMTLQNYSLCYCYKDVSISKSRSVRNDPKKDNWYYSHHVWLVQNYTKVFAIDFGNPKQVDFIFSLNCEILFKIPGKSLSHIAVSLSWSESNPSRGAAAETAVFWRGNRRSNNSTGG